MKKKIRQLTFVSRRYEVTWRYRQIPLIRNAAQPTLTSVLSQVVYNYVFPPEGGANSQTHTACITSDTSGVDEKTVWNGCAASSVYAVPLSTVLIICFFNCQQQTLRSLTNTFPSLCLLCCVCGEGFVQFLQYYYQSGCLYRLRALGERHNMDLTVGECRPSHRPSTQPSTAALAFIQEVTGAIQREQRVTSSDH